MTVQITRRVVEKAYRQVQSIRREYMMFTSAERCLRFVLHPTTLNAITKEFWEEQHKRGPGVHEDYWVESQTITRDAVTTDHRILGIKTMTDASVPLGEVELRAVLVRSWEVV